MAEIETASYRIRYATEHDVPVILQQIKELASYERALHEVLATPEKLFDTLSFPTSSDEKVRNKPGFAKALLIIPTNSSLSSSTSNPAQQVSAELELETSTNADPTSFNPSSSDSSKDEVAGFALFFNNYSTWLAQPGIYLEDLFVRPAYRGKGFGKALLQALARECVKENYGRLEWWVLKWNKPSIAFYVSETIGASDLGEEWSPMRVTGEALVKLAESRAQ
ncbi:Peroxygenase 1 [Neophaeococcomyces mojaviensis]|uniref:Peroxygenase 1 n=1 Tax=Neophaeococcomyces mojaviensis TaxID=3383035 RepID=A0ACC3A1S8_9EURO|nr:Peroxygenase 1 [Knufia sp. JES_112]